MINQKKKYFLKKKKKGGTTETLRSRFNRLNRFSEELGDFIESIMNGNANLDLDTINALDLIYEDLRNQITIFYILSERRQQMAIDRENDCNNKLKKIKSDYDKLVAELILIRKKHPDFVSENVKKFLG